MSIHRRLPAEPRIHHGWLRWVVLALGFPLALGGAYLYNKEVGELARARFQASTFDKASDIEVRLRAYADVLYALRGLFNASDAVTRDDFHEFVAALNLGERYPGLTNVSFAIAVSREGRRDFERAVRADSSALVRGLPDFSIQPPGERPGYVVLHYLEPIADNLPAWGLDLLADPLRRAVVERARDSGNVTSASGVTLLRDGKSAITSTLLRLAVYRGGRVPESVTDRQRRFVGVVGSTLRVGELVEATLGHDALARMRVRIYVGAAPGAPGAPGGAAEQPLYDSHPPGGAAAAADHSDRYATYAVNQLLAVGDREWRVAITPLADPVAAIDKAMVAGVLAGSLALVALLFSLMNSLATAQLRGIELAQRGCEAALLTALGEDLHSCIALEEAHAVLARQMPGLLPGTAGVLYLVEASHARASGAARWGAPRAVAAEFAAQDCQSIRRGQIYRVDDAALSQNCAHFAGDPPHCYVCVPLGAHDELIGMLHVQPHPAAGQATTFSEAEFNLVKAAAQHIALALANLELREKLLERATRDNLTRLYNRHYLLERLEQELDRARRHGRSIGVILLDVDHFKRFNDRFGHAAGDLVLRELAGVIQRLARSSDVACRYGGEEFLLLMPESTLEGALGKAEELRREVAFLAPEYEGQALGSVTISAGVAAFPVHAATADTLLRAADEALYEAKGAGRNRVIVSSARAPSSARNEA